MVPMFMSDGKANEPTLPDNNTTTYQTNKIQIATLPENPTHTKYQKEAEQSQFLNDNQHM